MSEQEHAWVGETVAGRYLLGKFLGGTDHSAVFATEIVHARAQKVAIKLIPAAGIDVDRQFARWKLLSAVSHTNLLKILDYGKCDLVDAPHLFVVTEFADEDLADILPLRALNADEARGMIEPVLETLGFLHGQKLIHTRLHPGNILATGDQIKLSSDSIVPEAEAIEPVESANGFAPPEWASGTATATTAADVWSLGATVVAALTQKAPVFDEKGDVALPVEVPEPFAAIARETLKQEAAQRISLLEIRGKLNPASAPALVPVVSEAARVPAKGAVGIDPVAVPLSKVPPPTLAERRPPVPAARPPQTSSRESRVYLLPLVAVVAFVAVLWLGLPKLLRHEPAMEPADASTKSVAPEKTAGPKEAGTKTSMTMPKKSSAPRSTLTETSQPASPVPPPVANVAGKSKAGDSARGEVLDQVLPTVSEKARGTIQGKVRISVRVHVNPTGTVDSAELDTPSSSKYFSELAISAAKRWQFSAPEVDGHSVASQWLLQFEFSSSETIVHPTQVSL